jgi:membrane-associated protein
VSTFIDIIRHLPEHLQAWAQLYGAGLYGILALVIFAETGLVVTPFLPGDSLLFAAGAILALGIPGLSLPVMCLVLILAAFTGDLVNYHVGRWARPRLENLRWLNRRHLERTHEFYARHGGKTIILARFVPIVRTYAPFVAGLGGMPLRRYITFCLTGGTAWITLFTGLGFFFGNIPGVRKNFELVILAIIGVSILPIVFEYVRAKSKAGHMAA